MPEASPLPRETWPKVKCPEPSPSSLYAPGKQAVFPESLVETWPVFYPAGRGRLNPMREEEAETAEPCMSALGSWSTLKTPSWPSLSCQLR